MVSFDEPNRNQLETFPNPSPEGIISLRLFAPNLPPFAPKPGIQISAS